MFIMRPGDVLSLKKAESWVGKNMLGFKAPKGLKFVVVYLGTEKDGEDMDVKAAMKVLGWVPAKKPREK